jgi:hypothetical protein
MHSGDFKILRLLKTQRSRQQQMWKRLYAGIQQAHRTVIKTAGILDMVFESGEFGLQRLNLW